MKKLLALPFIILFTSPVFAQDETMIIVNVNRVCAASVGIPYASDNFSDAEWEKIKVCVKNVKKYQD